MKENNLTWNIYDEIKFITKIKRYIDNYQISINQIFWRSWLNIYINFFPLLNFLSVGIRKIPGAKDFPKGVTVLVPYPIKVSLIKWNCVLI